MCRRNVSDGCASVSALRGRQVRGAGGRANQYANGRREDEKTRPVHHIAAAFFFIAFPLLFSGIYAYALSCLCYVLKLDLAVDECEERVIGSYPDVVPGMN